MDDEQRPSSVDTEQAPARHRRGLILGAVGGVLLALLVAGWFTASAVAASGYDAARETLLEAHDDHDLALKEYALAQKLLEDALPVPREVLDRFPDGLVADEIVAAATDAVDASDEMLAKEPLDLPEPPTAPAPGAPGVLWDALAGTAEIEASTTATAETAAAYRVAAKQLDLARESLESRLEELLEATEDAATEVSASRTAATNQSRIELDRVVAGDAPIEALDNPTPRAIGQIIDAIAAVEASQSAALAAQSHPLHAARAEAEALARSLLGGTRIDVEWTAATGELSATSQAHPDAAFANVTMSDDIAQRWGASDVRSFVAEVAGMAVLADSACAKLADDPAFGGDTKIWTSAWARSHGFTHVLNSTTGAQIEIASRCRPAA
ncbi:MAG: hypothetical protein M3Y29_07650 [Chloroflexota bacterium]|nr:hypothetical protein [Chloroflexota bacterium]